ncbi:MAG: polyisoprenoid-binding protein [Deltaproteobacteria bacterium]|nr:polyisoprenoid-binding protein [Deltaproteobacteria bacterium]
MRKILPVILGMSLAQAAYADTYAIDKDHSQVGFKIKHLAISTVPGTFSEFSGTFDFDPKNVAAAKVDATIAVSSVNTNQAKRDNHLRDADFFDVSKFPEMKFVSKKVTPVDADSFKVVGELTIRDVTKPVTLDVEFGGAAKDPWGNDRAAFTATTKFNRKDWGMQWNKALETGGLLVGEDVHVTLEIEGIKKS